MISGLSWKQSRMKLSLSGSFTLNLKELRQLTGTVMQISKPRNNVGVDKCMTLALTSESFMLK